ncbi:MAG TPA: hypothetical protein VJT75_11020 [Thermoleophilaceae bacterium]|nr:hypothetical protein [Thermoleophilaceae bacterium]
MGPAIPTSDRRVPPLDAAAGFSGLLFLVGFLIQGKPPRPDEPVTAISAYLADHRDAILAGDLMLAMAAAPFFWFAGVLRGYLAEAGESRLSAASALGVSVGTGIVLVAVAVQAGLVLNTADGPPELVRLGFDTFNALITIAGGCLAAGVGAAAVSALRSAALPRRLAQAGVITAVLQIVTLPGLVVERGPWAAGGAVPLLAFVALVAWYTVVTTHLVRGGRPRAAT